MDVGKRIKTLCEAKEGYFSALTEKALFYAVQIGNDVAYVQGRIIARPFFFMLFYSTNMRKVDINFLRNAEKSKDMTISLDGKTIQNIAQIILARIQLQIQVLKCATWVRRHAG